MLLEDESMSVALRFELRGLDLMTLPSFCIPSWQCITDIIDADVALLVTLVDV